MTLYVRSGSEFVVNTTQPRAQLQSDGTLLSNGNFIITWVDRDYGTSVGTYLKAQIFQPDGTVLGVELSLGTASSGVNNPAIASLANGGFVAIWGGMLGLQAQTFDANGVATSAAISVSSNTNVVKDVIGLANGGFAITWDDGRATGADVSGTGVHVSTYDQSGNVMVNQAIVNSATIGNQADASITNLSGGGYVITWTDRGVGSWQIKAQIYDASGVKSGSEFTVNPNADGSVESSVTTLSNGNFAVAWNDYVANVGPANKIQIYAANGTAIGSQIVVADNHTGNSTGPILTALSNGGFVLGWVGNSAAQNDGSGEGIFIQVYNENAQAVGGVQCVNDQLYGDQVLPSIVALANGGFVVNWTDLNGYGAEDDSVHAQIFMPDSNVPANDVTITSGGGGAVAAVIAHENETAVSFVRATPAATSPTLQFSISGGADAAFFTVDANSGLLRFATAPDYETPSDLNGDNVYEVIVTASDGTLSDSQTLSVTVSNGNDVPVMTSGTAFTVQENSLVAATVTAADPENNAITFSIQRDLAGPSAAYYDATKFSINATTGVISFIAAPNFEAPADYGADNVYDLIVSATDTNGGTSTSQAITITVANVNEGTVISSNGGGATAAFDVNENQLVATTVVARDNIGPSLSYSILGGVDAAKFTINATTGVLSFISAPNYESPDDNWLDRTYEVTVAATDGLLTDTQALTMTVKNVNEAPVLINNGGGATASISINENSTNSITTVFATDPENNPRTYSIVGGADAARFTINTSSGILSLVNALNFEAPTDAGANNVYDVIVQANDGSLVDTQAIAVTVLNVNDAPVFTSSAVLTVQENGIAAGIIAASDDDGQTLVYSINGGNDAARFTINAATGALSFVAAPNYEAPTDFGSNNIYNVNIGASDGSVTSIQNLAITVTNQYEGTIITSNGGGATAAFSVNENQVFATTVVVDNIVTFSIAGGADAALFAIDVNTGLLNFLTAPNYEAPNDAGANRVYDVIVAATDGVITDTQAIAITVNNVNEAPVITSNGGGDTASISINENSSLVTSLQAIDPENTTRTYSISGGSDASRFIINASTGELNFNGAPNFEAPSDVGGNNVYDVVVKASDGVLFDTQAIAVTVSNVNDAPVFTSGTAFTIQENNTAITTVSAIDEENQTVTYSVAPFGGTDYSNIFVDPLTGALRFLIPPNFEAPTDNGLNNVYNITVEARDGTSSSFQNIAITVANVNEAPVITSNGGGDTAIVSINENTTAAIIVSATDPENTARTYSIVSGADAAMFSINATTGLLTLLAPKNFEAPTDAGANNIYDVIVSASDGVQADTQAIGFRILNVNEAVTLTSGVNFSVIENQTAVTTITATDLDGTAPTFAIVGGVDAARFSINATTGALRFVTAPNFESPTDVGANNVYNVNVRASDGVLTDTRALAITVTDQNEAVVITSNGGGATAALAVVENSSFVTIVTSIDPENVARVYSLSGGADASLFTINAATGALNFASAPNFEAPADAGANNVYDVVVSATDGVTVDTQALAVTVTNTNEGLSFVSGSGFAVAENALVVGTVSAIDLDGDVVSYSISGGDDAALFAVDSSTGALSFITAPNYEAPTDVGGNNIYDIIVTATDGSLTATSAVSVSVGNVNEGVTITSAAAFTTSENSNSITTVTATDMDGDAVTYTIAGGADAARFNIDAVSGVLSFISAPNFEAPADSDGNNIYDVVVLASDGTLSQSQTLAVTIANVNEAPVITSGQTFAVEENQTAIATVAASDPENAAITYAVVGGADAAQFTIDAVTGVLSFISAPNFEAPADANADNIFDVVVIASDGTLSDSRALSITVNNVNEAPVLNTLLPDQTSAEDAAISFTLPAGSFSDVDNATLIYSAVLANDAALPAWLIFNASNLTFSGMPPQDFNGNIDVKVTATDGSVSANDVFTLAITPVNDGPVASNDGPLALLYNSSLSITAASLLANDVDVDGPALAITSVSNPTHGTVVLQGNGSILFTPDADYIGAASFTYAIADGAGGIATANVSINVQGVAGSTINGTAAIDNLVGTAGDDVISGLAGNDTLNGNGGVDRLIGGIGNDIYVVNSVGDQTVELAGEGTDVVQSSISWTLGANLENLTLTGSANINGTGNSAVNSITGNGGNNALNGGGGIDTLIGGLGDDSYIVDVTGVVTTEAASAGTDSVLSSVTWTLAANLENLVLVGAAAINGTGNTVANSITGNAADNILNGAAGADTLIGGFGNDTYVVDNIGDVVTENIGEGTDLVQAAVAWVLGADVENLSLTGTAAISGTGNSLNNILSGNSGANILNGGAGADAMSGGTGNDTYVVDDLGDTTTELAAGGTDLVQSSISWVLAGDVENLTLTGVANSNGTGNAAVNVITGNSGNNVLSGAGGVDTLVGGLGDDTYVVDVVGVVTTEAASAGTDTVLSSVTWTLATNLENLTLTGSTAVNATGNTLANILTGNSANNILSGGTGADTMSGGLGDDTYVVDNAGDVTIEATSAGTDLVQSSVTVTLAGNVENLTLTGTAAINGTGNTLDNVLTGNSGANILNGGSGADTFIGAAGNDTLTGGLGNDSFNFSTVFGKDVITDFTAGVGVADIINLTLGTAFDTYAEVMAIATQVGANTVFTFNAADTITLSGVLKTALVADDFMFT